MADKNFKVKTGLSLPQPLPVDQGGTGQTSTANTLNSLLPSQVGNSAKILSTDGTNPTWIAQSVAYQRGGTGSRPASPSVGGGPMRFHVVSLPHTQVTKDFTSCGC